MTEKKRQYNNTYISYDQWQEERCSSCGHRAHSPGCGELEDGNPHGAFAELWPCGCKTNSKEPYTEPPPPPPPKKPSGKICGVHFEETDFWGKKSMQYCNGQKGHDGDHSSNHDCCGDRYPVYVTSRHCEFCGRNEGWCTSCLDEHEKDCAKKEIKKLRGQLAKK